MSVLTINLALNFYKNNVLNENSWYTKNIIYITRAILKIRHKVNMTTRA